MSGNHWSDWFVESDTPVAHPCMPIGEVEGGFTVDDAMDRDELLRRIHEELDLPSDLL